MSLPLLLFGQLTAEDIPDLTGKVAVITGFNSGIGFETSKALLSRHAEVIGVCRSREHGDVAVADLQAHLPGARVSYKICNLELLSEVKSLAEDLLSSRQNINILINNAGRFLDEGFSLTKEGFEHTLAVDYYGHVYLSLLLLDRLISSGPSRIVNVISQAEMFGSMDWGDLRGAKMGTSGIKAYGRAKLMFLMWTFELQRRLRLLGAPVEAFAVHPGMAATSILSKTSFRYPFAMLTYCAAHLLGQTPALGAQSTIYAASSPRVAGHGGQYIGPSYVFNFFNCVARKSLNPVAHDPDAWQRLWNDTLSILQETTGQHMPSLPAIGTKV